MAYCFGDGFDCYATMADPLAGYWDGGLGVSTINILTAGRFTGSQAVRFNSVATANSLTKSSGVNDAVHHIVCAVRLNSTLTGTSAGMFFTLFDGVTAQCTVVFRTDGALLLTSGGPTGATLATYTGAVSAQATWIAFEIEVVINNTTGSFTVRKNGNTSNDFTLGSLNTRGGTANNYANKLTIGIQTTPAVNTDFDDILWRSDASSVPFVGDIRCYTRMPASDASVQFARSPASVTQSQATNSSVSDNTSTARYSSFTASVTGSISAISVSFATGFTGNCKLALFGDGAGGVPGAVIASATPQVNPVSGFNVFSFISAVPVVANTQYWIGISHDVTASVNNPNVGTSGRTGSLVPYASFPAANPSVGVGTTAYGYTFSIATSTNCERVNETQQDGTTSYVYDSTVGHADLYNIASIAATPASTVAVITRAFAEKLDAGFRQVTVQVKSGATTVQATPQALANNFGWIYRVDTVDPATGTAWTPAAVNALQIGPLVVA